MSLGLARHRPDIAYRVGDIGGDVYDTPHIAPDIAYRLRDIGGDILRALQHRPDIAYRFGDIGGDVQVATDRGLAKDLATWRHRLRR